ncbi:MULTISPECIES: phosphopyruvate hydratase [unclassified Fibrobacter]|uniref:phosphopyruvate hydratase n=1 Tax=unclassified Fibrobacter TaxID=2634177 RepID=UPI000D6BBBDE|nr:MULTISPECIES: phosphopyruvate hydratase [unclassified Fibrobacter]PWJ62311.1 enolase [Fibrobacter sp. UWR4]PZW68003.1 enolase [Fibrobacter sp. UWR1]
MASKIKSVVARQILDSRGNPSLEVDVTLENGVTGHAAVPSGASTGEREACELRDGDKKTYLGKGTLTAVKNVNTKIAKKIIGMDPSKQVEVDDAMIALDGDRMLKNKLGANAILGVSMAVCVAAAKDAKMPLYKYIAKISGTKEADMTLPCPMCNVINGGAHSSAPIDFQEFMIAPVGAKTFSKGLQMVTEIFHALKAVLKKGGFDTTVGDEGGFAPGVSIKPAKNKFGYEITGVMTLEKALDALKTATTNAGYKFGTDIKIALDVASSEFCDKNTKAGKPETYTFKKSTKKTLKSADMVKLYEKLIDKYSIFSIEDGLDEADWAGWKVMTDKLGSKLNLVGDDLFVTNPTIFNQGIEAGIANAILIKVNQVGSVSETIAAIKRAQEVGYAPIVSHRSGETEDTFIADLAVGTAAGQIKTGSLSRTDRVCKYNRLLRIEEELGKAAKYAGDPRKAVKAAKPAAKKACAKKACKAK